LALRTLVDNGDFVAAAGDIGNGHDSPPIDCGVSAFLAVDTCTEAKRLLETHARRLERTW